MKFTFKPSPNYRSEQSTSGIMKDLTLCLLAVTVFAVVYYTTAFGAAYGLRVVLLTLTGVVTSLVVDALYFKATKQDVKKSIASSYSWVTALILVLISPIRASYYAIIVCTAIAVFFGKLVFGGFGQNIFNPAAFGEAILMNNFAATYSADFTTGATPTTAAKAFSWLLDSSALTSVTESYGGIGGMFLGQYASTIGSTCALLLILCLVYLIWRKDIDWQVPVFYICTVFVETLFITLIHGGSASAAVFSVLAGGVLFCGVFMMTDPVTSPVTLPGRVVFAIGAASFTVIIRMKSNFADGVLYSILLMNMLTPAIDKLFDGNQIKDAKKFRNTTLIASCIMLAVTLLIGGFTSTAKAEETTPATTTTAEVAESTQAAATAIALNDDFADNKVEVTDNGDGTYTVSADGFGLINNMGDDYSRNEAVVTVEDGAVVSVEVTNFGDTAGIGDTATSADALGAYVGKTLDDSVDAVSGATFTSTSVASMVSAALNEAAK